MSVLKIVFSNVSAITFKVFEELRLECQSVYTNFNSYWFVILYVTLDILYVM